MPSSPPSSEKRGVWYPLCKVCLSFQLIGCWLVFSLLRVSENDAIGAVLPCAGGNEDGHVLSGMLRSNAIEIWRRWYCCCFFWNCAHSKPSRAVCPSAGPHALGCQPITSAAPSLCSPAFPLWTASLEVIQGSHNVPRPKCIETRPYPNRSGNDAFYQPYPSLFAHFAQACVSTQNCTPKSLA